MAAAIGIRLRSELCLRRRRHPAALLQLSIDCGGKYATSNWWTPTQREVPVALYVTHWQPLPVGVDPLTLGADLYPPAPERPAKQPEPVYEPGGVDVRLTPVPRNLLLAMAAGAVVKESTMIWASWQLARPGLDPEKLSSRGVDRLREVAFIERDGVLPPGHLARMHRFDWRIKPAGGAWLAANGSPK